MSKIGKKPILVPKEISVEIKDGILEFKKGDNLVNLKILPYVKAEILSENNEKELVFSINNGIKQAKSNWGTMASLAKNVMNGLIKEFSKSLEVEGIGFRANMEGTKLVLNIGYSHPVKYEPKKGVKVSVEKNVITVSGIDKALVGQTAAEIRAFKKPEPYQGKGIRYKGEFIRRKEGKKAGVAK